MAKDVVTFLNWAAEPEHDERKKMGIKAVIIFSTLTALSLYVKRFKWSAIKSRKIRASFTISYNLSAAHVVSSLQPTRGQERPLNYLEAWDILEQRIPCECSVRITQHVWLWYIASVYNAKEIFRSCVEYQGCGDVQAPAGQLSANVEA